MSPVPAKWMGVALAIVLVVGGGCAQDDSRGAGSGCRTGEDCASGLFCETAAGDCGGEGACQERPGVCPEYFSATCGCDGKTYGNPCEAAAAGASVNHPGACESPG